MAQQDDLCFMQTASGQRISLGKICGKSGDKTMSGFMWDETNYDPKYVIKYPDGFWSLEPGAPYPFRMNDGTTFFPDGRVSFPGGATIKAIVRDGKLIGNQYYKEDGVTPLAPGENYTYSSGMAIEQKRL